MPNYLEFLALGTILGAGGSATIDTWNLILRRTFHIATLDLALLGRWIGHLRNGQVFHTRIAASEPVPGERILGWTAHYAIGAGFAFLLLAISGADWAKEPTIAPALILGVATVAAPWFIMQPAFGAGIAGSKTPHPWKGRLRNLGTHVAYGLGLYLTALSVSLLWPS